MGEGSTENVAFYDRLASEYDLFFHDLEKNMQEEGDWLQRVLSPFHPRRVLDASCGSGRQSIPLAQRGFQVTAADPSTAMLDAGRENARHDGVQIEWVEADFTGLPALVDGPFDAVVALGNGLCNQETREAISASLDALRRLTADSGVCLIGIKDYDQLRQGFEPVQPHGVHDTGNTRTILFDVWDVREPQLVSTSFLLTGNGSDWQVETAATHEYMLDERELRMLASQAGFRQVDRVDHPSEAVFLLR